MEGRIDGWTDKRVDGWAGRWIDGWTDASGWKDEQMGVQGQINGWMIGRMDRQLAGWKRSQMDRGTGQMDRDRANGRMDLTFHRYAWNI